jgi:hypothetical protein
MELTLTRQLPIEFRLIDTTTPVNRVFTFCGYLGTFKGFTGTPIGFVVIERSAEAGMSAAK